MCDYSNAYILVTGHITGSTNDAITVVAFKNCSPFKGCTVKINDKHIEQTEDLNVVMSMYNLIEYSNNYLDSSASRYQYRRDEINDADADVLETNSTFFKYKTNLLAPRVNNETGNMVADGGTRKIKNAKIVVPLRYLSNFFRALEMPLINCNVHLELTWTKGCLLSNVADNTKFQLTDTKLYVPVVTLSANNNINFTKQLNEGFKQTVYWNEYKSKSKEYNANL